ncbi:MAG: glycosyltransferase family 4 protein [Candidatus Diapherotrites archaeon]|uniref:Glycosyltransferase family 4 protein n=1 Tax=Candidatus Iainarchaeum sp. TaxID=3101447 RepID=A0A938YXG3_9ARCH|nr:glycosyltransferase family 4 protein [Candidatus Diapherotrites archaeon]
MRVFFITHTYALGGSGGGEQFVSNFLAELRKRKHEVFVFTAGGTGFERQEKELGLQVYHCPAFGHHAFHKYEYVLLSWKAAMLAKEFTPDVIHAQNDVFPGLIGSVVKWQTKKPLVLAVEYLSEQAVSLNLKLVFALNKFFLPKVPFDAVVSWSKFVVDKFFVPWGIPGEKIHIIPGAVNVKQFAKKVKPHPKLAKLGKSLIVSAKPLHSTNAEGITYIVKAMAIVAKKHPEWKYVVVGEGQSRPALEKLVNELGLQDNVILFGALPNSEIPSVYAAAEIVAHSFAFKATTSIALMESMAAGKAIVATDSGEVKPTLGETGLLPKQKDEKSIAAALLAFIESPALRREKGLAAQKKALKEYGIESVVDKFLDVYKRVGNAK